MGLTKREIEDFKNILIDMRNQLTRQVKGFSEDARELEGVKGLLSIRLRAQEIQRPKTFFWRSQVKRSMW